ncbi:MAG: DUF1189 family protein [Chloroflexota bacterium]
MESTPIPQQSEENTWKDSIGWFGASFVLPFYNRNFYINAVTKPFFNAVLFFFFLMTFVTFIGIGEFFYSFADLKHALDQAYESGFIPEISIEQGRARVDGEQPMIFVDEPPSFIAIDTTGQITEIDRSRYNQAFLLTETELHFLDDYEYQILPLRDLNQAFDQDAILINQEIVSNWLNIFFVVAGAIAAVVGWVWNTGIKFMYLIGIGLVLWGIFSIFYEQVSFNTIVITGIYAYLPALIFSYSLELIKISFWFDLTILLLIFWITNLIRVLNAQRDNLPIREIWLKPALLGIPIAVFITLNLIFSWEFAPPIILIGLLATIGTLLAIENGSNLNVQFTGE